MVITDLYHVMYTLQDFTIPGISANVIKMPTPIRDHKVGGYKVQYDPAFSVIFEVDENLGNWKEIATWITGISPPDNEKQHEELISKDIRFRQGVDIHGIYRDIRVIITTNGNAASPHEFVFVDCFPIKIYPLKFTMTSAERLTCSADFAFSKFEYRNTALSVN